MARPNKGTRITKATVDAAVRDAQAKMSWEYPDPECAGLSLRVRGKAVTWSFRGPRLGGKNRRWYLGGHTVTPKDARQRASQVRMRIRQGLDPTPLLTEILTGLKPQEQLDLRIEERPSWEWSDAIKTFLAYLIDNARHATIDDYRATLENTPELEKLKGRMVCDILREEIEEAVEKIRLRGVKTHHKKVLMVTRRFFNWLSEGARRRETSVPINFLAGAKAGPALRNVVGRRVVNKGIPETNPIGRALAIARSGTLGEMPSHAIELLIGTVSRRRGVVGAKSQDFQPCTLEPGAFVWFQPPAFRKTADRMQSESPHQVPIVGFAIDVVNRLERIYTRIVRPDDDPGWYFPVARARRKGQPPKDQHMNVSTLNHNIDAMPGVYRMLSPHALRRAFGSYGSMFGGFKKDEAKMVLDHLEGEGDDVTRGYYDLDPRIGRKLEMMHWWTAWCDEQCALAIAADPALRDPEALRQACYIQRYGQEAWNAKIKKTHDTGAPLWPTDSDGEIAA